MSLCSKFWEGGQELLYVFSRRFVLISLIRCTQLEFQCRKIHDLGAMDLVPSPTRGLWCHLIENTARPAVHACSLCRVESGAQLTCCIPCTKLFHRASIIYSVA